MQKDAQGLSIDLNIKSALCRGKQRAQGLRLAVVLFLLLINRSPSRGLAGKSVLTLL